MREELTRDAQRLRFGILAEFQGINEPLTRLNKLLEHNLALLGLTVPLSVATSWLYLLGMCPYRGFLGHPRLAPVAATQLKLQHPSRPPHHRQVPPSPRHRLRLSAPALALTKRVIAIFRIGRYFC